jgi:hypothetical protein
LKWLAQRNEKFPGQSIDLKEDVKFSKQQKNFFLAMEQVEKLEERWKNQTDFMNHLAKE